MQEKLIICPEMRKTQILRELNKNNSLEPIKFMTKEEYINNYYCTYNDNTILYLMDKYNINIDVCKVYLKYIKIIDENKIYNNTKLDYLSKLKRELIENNLLVYNPLFKEYIKNKIIEVDNYYDLDLYEEKALNYKFNIPTTNNIKEVYEFNTMEEEINYICIKIIELLNKGININNIYLCNVSKDYYYTIYKLFSYYNIPIDINFNNSIYSTKVVKDYLDNEILDLDNDKKQEINKKLLKVLEELILLDNTSPNYRKILIDKLKHTTYNHKNKNNCIKIKDIYKYKFNEDDYVFVLGFNNDSLPSMYKDIDYIKDNIKYEINMYDTTYLNKRSKEIVIYLLSNIPNIYITYKLNSPFQSFYKSSLISEYNIDIKQMNISNYNYSNKYNKILLAEKLDTYHLYGSIEDYLKELNTHYIIDYNTYTNKFTGIDNNIYLNNINKPLQLSYTTLNSYNECSFKYYIKNVLKIDNYEDTFSSFIGSLYHKILSLYLNVDFDFEKEYKEYLSKRDITPKEKLLLVRIKRDLKELINILEDQQLLTGYDNNYNEGLFKVNIDNDIETTFIGFIDKIMYYKKLDNIYYSIVDYKSGLIDTHIEPLKYGLHMQLPIYLYLINESNKNNNYIFTGLYYQNILFNYPTWSKNIENEKKKKYLLNGYSTNDISVLERFDSTYENSELIKSMKYKDDKFGYYTKIMDENIVNELVDYTKKIIESKSKSITRGEFDINPKMYDGKNISCEFCSFKDICYMKDKDLIYLEKQKDLSFLGGEE